MDTLHTVLVVDESWYRRWRTCLILQRLPIRIEIAPDAVVALARASRQPPDAVVINLDGKHLDGQELRRQMQADSKLAAVPLVSISWERHFLRAQEFTRSLTARFHPSELLSVLMDLMPTFPTSHSLSSHRRRALIVDDWHTYRAKCAETLWNAGFLVETASHGEEALGKLNLRKPDILILDHIMPGMDGLELRRRMLLMQGMETVKVVFLPDRAVTGEVGEAWELGVDCYLTKPFHQRELEVFVSRLPLHPHNSENESATISD